MNTPETKDKLKNMFCEIKMENPSADFMKELMLRIEKETAAKKKRQYFLTLSLILTGILSIILISGSIIYFLKIEITTIKFPNIYFILRNIFKDFSIDPKITGLGLIILLLLSGDLILRKFISHKKDMI
ncbi:MAG: hypothetical protein LBJ72_06345 [Dysgonamonadaceae bacterium]|jgi:hypothetical protein|nr:hypothetical protein [Dysgonamonadaceae bacterium]